MFSTWVMLLTSVVSWILPWWSEIVLYIMEEVENSTDLKKQPKPVERLPVDLGCLPSYSQAGLNSAHPELPGCDQDHECSRLKVPLWRAALFTPCSTWTSSNTELQREGRAGDLCTHRKQMGCLSWCLRCSRDEDTQNSSKQGNL